MARIPETELERLKNEVSVQRLAQASGEQRGRYPLFASPEAGGPEAGRWRHGRWGQVLLVASLPIIAMV